MKKRSGNKLPPAATDEATGKKICRHPDCETLVSPPRRSWCGPACVDDWMIRNNPGVARSAVHARDAGICWICWRDCDEIRLRLRQLQTIQQGGILSNGWRGYKRLSDRAIKRFGFEERPASLHESIEQAATRAFHRSEVRRGFGKPYDLKKWRFMVDHELAERVRAVHERIKTLAAARRRRMIVELKAEGFDPDTRSSFWDMDHIKPVAAGGGGCGLDNLQTLCQPCHKNKTARQAAEKAKSRKS
tara:strand:- start:14943 stop:15680 length:738 start_codon:yes stop_codon:yes gene_type:complete